MGTWSHEPFGNDTAADWAHGLVETKDYALVAQAIQNVLDNGAGYLDSDLAAEAVAAAEVLAKALGRDTQADAHTQAVDAWLASMAARPSADLLSNARDALDRITSPGSELVELWEESDHCERWRASIRALHSALGA